VTAFEKRWRIKMSKKEMNDKYGKFAEPALLPLPRGKWVVTDAGSRRRTTIYRIHFIASDSPQATFSQEFHCTEIDHANWLVNMLNEWHEQTEKEIAEAEEN
jgi:hypothetical protein